jgi:hypothetical protein
MKFIKWNMFLEGVCVCTQFPPPGAVVMSAVCCLSSCRQLALIVQLPFQSLEYQQMRTHCPNTLLYSIYQKVEYVGRDSRNLFVQMKVTTN